MDRVVHEMIPGATPFQDDAQDFFVIIPGSFDWDVIPDFVVGRPAYDNWLVDYAFHQPIDSVDVSATLHAIHQSGEDGDKSGHAVRGFSCLCYGLPCVWPVCVVRCGCLLHSLAWTSLGT